MAGGPGNLNGAGGGNVAAGGKRILAMYWL